MNVEFDFWDVKELAYDLTSLGPAIEAKAAAAVGKVTYMGAAEAKYAAPVDTGFLMNSISVDIKGLVGEYGPTAHYGIYQELGTSRMPGQPYMEPSYDIVAPLFEDAIYEITQGLL